MALARPGANRTSTNPIRLQLQHDLAPLHRAGRHPPSIPASTAPNEPVGRARQEGD